MATYDVTVAATEVAGKGIDVELRVSACLLMLNAIWILREKTLRSLAYRKIRRTISHHGSPNRLWVSSLQLRTHYAPTIVCSPHPPPPAPWQRLPGAEGLDPQANAALQP